MLKTEKIPINIQVLSLLFSRIFAFVYLKLSSRTYRQSSAVGHQPNKVYLLCQNFKKLTLMKKHWKLLSTDEEKVKQLQKALQVHPVFCHLLVQRGLLTYNAARQFFRPKWEDLHDPFLMKDMDIAVRRLADAIREKRKDFAIW